MGQDVLTKFKIIIKIGNRAVHSENRITESYAIRSLRELCDVMYWFARTYAKAGVPTHPSFNLENLPKSKGKLIKMAAEKLQSLQKEAASKDEKLSLILADNSRLNDELKEKRAEVARAKAECQVADTYNYSEEETRDYFIDLLLNEAGWPLDQAHDREYEVTGMPNESGTGYVDYVLWGDNGKPLAVVEANAPSAIQELGKTKPNFMQTVLNRKVGNDQ